MSVMDQDPYERLDRCKEVADLGTLKLTVDV